MLCLLQTRIIKLLMMRSQEVSNLCLQMAPLMHLCKRGVESFPTQRKVCSQTSETDLSNLAQGDSGDVCQQEAYASSGPSRTPKIDKLGLG